MNSATYHRRMDFGIGEFLKYFDEHFGKTATKIFVGFIGLCGSLIWEHVLVPIYGGFEWIISGKDIHFPAIGDMLAALYTFLIMVMSYLLAVVLLDRLSAKRQREAGNQIREGLRQEAARLQKEVDDSQKNFIEWYLSVDVVKAIRRENELRKMVGQEPIKYPTPLTIENVEVLSKLLAEIKPSSPTPDKQ